jgi:hypothetical protein
VLRDLAYLDSVFAQGEVRVSLLCLLQYLGLILGWETAADGTGLLGSEVEGSILLVLVEEAELLALLKVDDGQDASNRLSQVVTV